MQSTLSHETEAVLLLCGHFAPRESAAPLDLGDYNRLAEALRAADMTPASLLQPGALNVLDWERVQVAREKVEALLERGTAMAIAVERWTSAGLWIIARPDEAYPARLRQHLGRSAPALLFGVGDVAALGRGGLAIVGSRDIDADGQAYTAAVAAKCAKERIPVVSGGARGVDETALMAAFEAGGAAVAALPEGIGKASVASKYRVGIREERLVLVSPYAPHAPFSVGNAMGRNKLIYALADAALVVRSALRSGGTWAGAEEELTRRPRPRLVYVRAGETRIEGNEALLSLGARKFPEPPFDGGIRPLLGLSAKPPDDAVAGAANLDGPASVFAIEAFDSDPLLALETPLPGSRIGDAAPTALPIADHDAMRAETSQRLELAASPVTAYDVILPLLLTTLVEPRTAAEIAIVLDVAPAQAKRWLDRALQEKRIVKKGRPARFQSTGRTPLEQPSLFG